MTQPKLHLTQYLQSIFSFPVGNIKLELEQPSEWIEYTFPTGQPLEQPYPMHGRLYVRLEFDAYTELNMGDQIGSLMVVKGQKVEAPEFQPSKLLDFRTSPTPRTFWRYTVICLHGNETDSLFKYALGG